MNKIYKLSVVLLSIVMTFTLTLNISAQDDTNIMEADVVVIGGGGAGLVSALKASENGADVILLEKMAYMGGATMLSAGIIPAAGTSFQAEAGIVDTPEQLALDILRPSHYSVRQDLVDTIALNAGDIVEWMDELGVKWNLLTGFLYKGQSNYRMHQAEGQGAEITKVLIDEIYARDNIRVLLETPGTGLLTTNDDRVIGVTAENVSGEIIVIKADNVILATSGFAANDEMMKKYIPEITAAYPRVAPGATGEGIVWAVKLGADVANMDAYQGYAPISNITKDSLDLSMLYRGAILVNTNTARFTDEYLGYSELSAHVINQPGNIAYLVLDKNVAEGTSALEKYEEDGILFKADTPAELAEKIGLDSEGMKEVFANYREAIKVGEGRFNRTKLPENWEAPFYAIEVTSDLRHTQGGIVINTDAQVLKTDGEVIKGLYAAGGVTEGFSSSGGPAYMSGNGLLQAFVFGKIAGENAAANLIEVEKEVSAVSDKVYKDGTYTGLGRGLHGPIEVSVRVSNGKIKSVTVFSHEDTPEIADSAIEKLSEKIEEINSPDVEIVSGATYTSNGLIEAVKDALKNAE
ncbi:MULTISPECIES: flavocytochrome c [unclassified Halanaerobium]|uniref:flavocytochrome c n=1 Tax=unclassified Halanaerobium TaxID=2641197 RepID=UPI000DF280CB|nr:MULTISPECIES: flavocytochrome c [unclassified Halanaerobium]RCW50754.1 fumarate reductase flavoprotein subunit [Halanaerobium sp. MA284_MarDTE_T2]RCW80194.1 fumarate reductase flavoprotein subunit [Halanaerobium sp. DL-01]